MTYHGLDHFVGNTPLIRLNRISDLTGCEILGKAEFMNPGGSVKDRAALGIIRQAEKDGQLFPGNTGIGLTIIGQARGYKSVIIIPETQAPEKIALLRALGAEVIPVPAKPYSDPDNYNHIARRLAEEKGWFWANQFDNLANRQAHFDTTGPEILAQTDGTVDAFVSAVGTGGTLAGTSLFLKSRNPDIATVCADPYGAAMWGWFTQKRLDLDDGDSFAEGIGQGRVTKNIEDIQVDQSYRIDDQMAISLIHQLLREEGLFVGLSSGINIGGALRYAQDHGPGKTIVTILCDTGQKYQSKLYNPEWLAANDLVPGELVL
jgi:cysteine synthase A